MSDLPDPIETAPKVPLWRRLLPLAVLVAAFIIAWATGLTDYLSLDALRDNRERLEAFKREHFLLALVAYVLIYIVAVIFSLPGALILTLSGGMLFGAGLGTAAAVTSATIGATVIFIIARSSYGALLRQRAGPVVGKLLDGFERNAASYLLTLRLIPGVPFFAVNLAAGLVRMRLGTYVLVTLVGILPGSLIYASLGSSLVTIFARGETPNLSIVTRPHVLGPLIGLAALSLLPVAWHAWRTRKAPGA